MAARTKITVKGGWIDVSHDGETVTLAAVGTPLRYLTQTPTSIPARHKQTEDRGRFRRLAFEQLRDQDPTADLDDADVAWSWRAG